MPATFPSTLLPYAIASQAGGAYNTIPFSTATAGAFSIDIGYPAETSQPLASGGIAPRRLDENGAFNLLSQHTAWQNAGGQYFFNSTLSTALGGYPKGAVIMSDTKLFSCVSAIDNNTGNFNSNPSLIGTDWIIYGGVNMVATQPFVAFAWATFDLSGTVGAACTIAKSYNVAGIVKTASGKPTVTFTNAAPDANYAVAGINTASLGGANCAIAAASVGSVPDNKTATMCELVFGTGTAVSNPKQCTVIFFAY